MHRIGLAKKEVGDYIQCTRVLHFCLLSYNSSRSILNFRKLQFFIADIITVLVLSSICVFVKLIEVYCVQLVGPMSIIVKEAKDVMRVVPSRPAGAHEI